MKIELQEEHINILKGALETYSRLRMGQFNIAFQTALMDKDSCKLSYTETLQLENKLKENYFPELESNSFNGIGRDKEADIAYEMYQLLRQYTAMVNHTEPTEHYFTKDFDDPLEISDVKLPVILEEDYKHHYIQIKDSAIIECYHNKDYEKMFDLIDDANFPKGSRSQVILEDGKYFYKVKKPLRK